MDRNGDYNTQSYEFQQMMHFDSTCIMTTFSLDEQCSATVFRIPSQPLIVLYIIVQKVFQTHTTLHFITMAKIILECYAGTTKDPWSHNEGDFPAS